MDVGALTPLVAGLVDDAGLFPPSSLPMAAALERHRRSASPVLSGRFLVPTSRVPELLALLRPDDALRVHLVVDEDAPVPTDGRVEVLGIERRGLPADDAALPTWVEGVPASALAGTGLRAKVRCGGAAIPAVDELASWVVDAVGAGVPFKATAGLHRAVRGDESTDGRPHHGYLNLLLAVSRATEGGDVAAVLASTDRAALAAEARTVDAARVRSLLTSYGSCDTDLPVHDAKELDL